MSEVEETSARDEVVVAVNLAKDFVRRAYAGEVIENVGLEEIKLDETGQEWKITIGFSRPWDNLRNPELSKYVNYMPKSPQRTYKVVTVDMAKGAATSIANRDVDAA